MGLTAMTDKGVCAKGVLLVLARLLPFLAVCLLVSQGASAAESALRMTGYRMAGDAVHTRIVMEFDREPDVRWFLLRGPNRLVVDLPRTDFTIGAKDLRPRGLVRLVRYGGLENSASRLIMTGKGPFDRGILNG